MREALIFLFIGFVAGVSISMPLGPGGFLCIQRTISKGRKSGFISGLGTVSSDLIYTTLALFCLSIITPIIEDYRPQLFLICGVILIVIGIIMFLTNPVKLMRQKKTSQSSFGDYLGGFVVAFSNPGCIFLILGVFTFLGKDLQSTGDLLSTIAVLLGLCIGGSTWWMTLSTIVNHWRKHFRLRQLWMLNRIFGIVLGILGVVSCIEGLSILLRSIL